MLRPSSVAIGGVATASVLGASHDQFLASLRAKRVGLSQEHRFKRWTTSPLGEIKWPELQSRGADHLLVMVSTAVRQLAAATGVFEHYRPEEIGLFLGTTTAALLVGRSNMQKCFDGGGDACRTFLTREDQHGSLTEHLKSAFPIGGIDVIYSTACSAGALAIAEARDAVRMGLCKAAIAGGFDSLTEITISGFEALQVVDRDFCQPFSPDRKGMNLAEGGGLLLLEADCKRPIAFILGAGAASEGYHMTHPDPSGNGMRLAMVRALADAGLGPERIDYINAHGTGTIPNDSAEKIAITELFGTNVPFASTKSLHGHTLGGAGALEAAISLAAMQEQVAWNADANRPLQRVMSNSFGFGGNNVSLIFGRENN